MSSFGVEKPGTAPRMKRVEEQSKMDDLGFASAAVLGVDLGEHPTLVGFNVGNLEKIVAGILKKLNEHSRHLYTMEMELQNKASNNEVRELRESIEGVPTEDEMRSITDQLAHKANQETVNKTIRMLSDELKDATYETRKLVEEKAAQSELDALNAKVKELTMIITQQAEEWGSADTLRRELALKDAQLKELENELAHRGAEIAELQQTVRVLVNDVREYQRREDERRRATEDLDQWLADTEPVSTAAGGGRAGGGTAEPEATGLPSSGSVEPPQKFTAMLKGHPVIVHLQGKVGKLDELVLYQQRDLEKMRTEFHDLLADAAAAGVFRRPKELAPSSEESATVSACSNAAATTTTTAAETASLMTSSASQSKIAGRKGAKDGVPSSRPDSTTRGSDRRLSALDQLEAANWKLRDLEPVGKAVREVAEAHRASVAKTERELCRIQEELYSLRDSLAGKSEREEVVQLRESTQAIVGDLGNLWKLASSLKQEVGAMKDEVKGVAERSVRDPLLRALMREPTLSRDGQRPAISSLSDGATSAPSSSALSAIERLGQQITEANDTGGMHEAPQPSNTVRLLLDAVKELNYKVEAMNAVRRQAIADELPSGASSRSIATTAADARQLATSETRHPASMLLDSTTVIDAEKLFKLLQAMVENIQILLTTKADALAVQRALDAKGDSKVLAEKANRAYCEALFDKLQRTVNELALQNAARHASELLEKGRDSAATTARELVGAAAKANGAVAVVQGPLSSKTALQYQYLQSVELISQLDKLRKAVKSKAEKAELDRLAQLVDRLVAMIDDGDNGAILRRHLDPVYCLACDRKIKTAAGDAGSGGRPGTTSTIPLFPSATAHPPPRSPQDLELIRQARSPPKEPLLRKTAPLTKRLLAGDDADYGLVPSILPTAAPVSTVSSLAMRGKDGHGYRGNPVLPKINRVPSEPPSPSTAQSAAAVVTVGDVEAELEEQPSNTCQDITLSNEAGTVEQEGAMLVSPVGAVDAEDTAGGQL